VKGKRGGSGGPYALGKNQENLFSDWVVDRREGKKKGGFREGSARSGKNSLKGGGIKTTVLLEFGGAGQFERKRRGYRKDL